MTQSTGTRYNVAILGAGVAGSTLATILARHNVDVLLIDAGLHPRFAVGESTVPYATVSMQIMAERYDVPELSALSDFRETAARVSTTCGQKQNFGFVYHEQGRPPEREKANQVVLPTWYRTEAHWFRQDIDTYVFNLAVRYGAVARLNTRITEIDVDPGSGVRLRAASGEEFDADYLVDATGFRSVLAERFGLRELPTRARTHSRSLFTHMIGVQPFDEVSYVDYGQPSRWHDGTLHHVFDGGWLWVIPFDNHDTSMNPLCSVGLTLTGQAVVNDREAPEKEFAEFLQRFPAVAEQFRTAKAVRPWVSTGRLQYSASNTVGDRFCLTAQSAGAIDALFSRGLANSFQTVNSLAWRIIDAARDGDWSTTRFVDVDAIQQRMFDMHDDLAYASYVAFRDYGMWNAMIRVWDTYSFYAAATLEHALGKFMLHRDSSVFQAHESGGSALATGIRELLASARTTCEQVERGEVEPAAATETLLGLVERGQFWPDYMPHRDSEVKFFDMDRDLGMRIGNWSRNEAPLHIRKSFS
ncbi:FAD-dependent oxidoreductase [Rhodococcus maanshanensis]|uniref:NAD(P)/FAD-dependent oxidoreductase n=1 Tax=Rhodococcus maanshanensis TaxID=183556 RepID=UPI0022B32949|nr:tryptophan 7-halogenase [Rhodococcus maanshanensis]MCZ4556782.1 FAD-dependent oxidoreductase [Rhodococcus maanshanensis]